MTSRQSWMINGGKICEADMRVSHLHQQALLPGRHSWSRCIRRRCGKNSQEPWKKRFIFASSWQTMWQMYLDCFPSPLSVLGVLGQSPQYEVGLKGLGAQDVISEQGHFQSIQIADKVICYLSFCFKALASTASENLRWQIVNSVVKVLIIKLTIADPIFGSH